MDKDLETYNVQVSIVFVRVRDFTQASCRQLSQVELALLSDPGNTDLTSLQTELKELIALTEQAIDGQPPTTDLLWSATLRAYDLPASTVAPLVAWSLGPTPP